MKVLVTGGAGFIGSNLCDSLLADGHRVVCVDNFNSFYNSMSKERNISSAMKNSRFRLYRNDILDYRGLEGVFRKHRPSIVMHLAAMAGVRPSIERPLLYEEVNVRGALNILELCRCLKVKRLVFASSSSVYGNCRRAPFCEDEPLMPISPYAATKLAGEALCHTYHHLYGLSIICLRFFTVYGPRGRPDMAVYRFTDRIYNGREVELYGRGSSRDYTYIGDIVNGVKAAMKCKRGFEIINLGNSNPIKLSYLISLIEGCLKKKAKKKLASSQPGDVMTTYASIDKARRILGYKPRVKIEEGIRLFVEWYLSERG
ncbi:TPA: NAD-dependent epimerase/dehydratase family protein [Candidatus Woesearchaeota archaeon]|nr:NAD-dependent epimerase/dehydratase family protein [Candidatus Woesearchaeota archaeon]